MHALRSRAGIVAMTAGATALLSVPVVALAKGPPEVVRGGNDTARSVAAPQANIPAANRGQSKKPDGVPKPAPAPKAPAPSGHARRAGQVSAPAGGSAGASGGNVSASPRRAAQKAKSNGAPPAHAKAYGHRSPPGHARRRSHAPAEGSSDPNPVSQPAPSGSPDKPSRPDKPDKVDSTGPLNLPSADSPDSSDGDGDGDGGVAAAVVSDTVVLPDDASPETLPFTGIQLGLLALIGLTSLVGGFALRRGATR